MRILILSDRIPPENAGGAEKIAWAVARGLKANGHDVHVIAATRGQPFEEMRDGIPTYHLHVRYPERFQAFLALYNPQVYGFKTLYQQIQPDVVSAFNIHSDLTYYSIWLAHRLGYPTTITLQDVMAFSYTKLTHFIDPKVCGIRIPSDYRLPQLHNLRTMRLRYNPLRNTLIRRTINNAVDVRIAGSDALRQALHANGLHDFRVIYGSVIPDDFYASQPTIVALRTRLGLDGKKVILFAGRLSADKGSVQILSALDQVLQRVPNAQLLTLTRASLESQGLTRPEYQHLLNHVTAGGWLQGEELAAAYHLADVAVVPSICLDVFPTINLEAMATATPVIATCYGGSPEAIIDGETGFIVNPFDTEEFAGRIIELLSQPEFAERMGAAGRKRLLTQFTLENQVTEMEQAYRDAIKQHSMTTRQKGRE
jgi:glycosyltransferase involved in cell wall biosynthesis